MSKFILNPEYFPDLDRATKIALEQTAEALHTEVVQAQVVPRDTGNLQGEAFFADFSNIDNFEADLVHATPYARRLYYHPEYNFNKAKQPNAKGRWFEDWFETGTSSKWVQNAFNKFLRRQYK